MKNKHILRVADTYRDQLATMNLLSYDELMFSDLGSIVEKFKTQEIRRIESHGTVAYLKRRLTSPFSKSLEMYLEGQRAHSAPVNEYLHICALQRHQLPVMNAMAAGEQRRLGFPGCGFVLVEEVKGIQLDRMLCQCEDSDKIKELLQSYGQLTARLHRAGFYCPLRLKDIIVTDDRQSLVMIDRETRHPYPHYRSKYRARRSLRIAFRRTIREYPSFDEAHTSIIMQSYNESTSRRD